MSKNLRLKDVMTETLYSVPVDTHAGAARRMMEDHKIRHLPVMNGKRIVGLISERDLALAGRGYRGRDFDHDVRVGDLCLFQPVALDENTSVHEAASRMGKMKIGSVLVLRNGALAGIFTATDACRLLAELAK